MHSFRADQFRMMGVLSPWLTANLPAIGKSKAAAKEAADVLGGLPAVQAKAGLTATETKRVTERRSQQQLAFETRILAMLGPMQMVATALKDMDFLGLVTIGRTTFKELRPELQAGVGQQVLAKAKANAAALARPRHRRGFPGRGPNPGRHLPKGPARYPVAARRPQKRQRHLRGSARGPDDPDLRARQGHGRV